MIKKMFFLAALMLISAAMLAPQGLSAQKGVVKVQGNHPHELLTRQAAQGKLRQRAQMVQQDTNYIDPGDIQCWAYEPNVTSYTDTAYLLIKFTDGKSVQPFTGDSLLVWGYCYNDQYVPHHTIDMLRTVANTDTRLTVLLQYTGTSGYSVGGVGFNHGKDCSRVPVVFDYKGAVSDTTIVFRYTGNPNCDRGQVAVPPVPQTLAQLAIEIGDSIGVIDHPFNAFYGYPAYDYDYWILNPSDPDSAIHSWQAGWQSGYWGFYVATDLRIPGLNDYAEYGISYQELHNQDVHGFVFEIGGVYPPAHDFSGTPYYPDCTNICRSCQTTNR